MHAMSSLKYALGMGVKRKRKERKNLVIGPAASSPAMEIRAGHRAPRPTPEDQTSCSKNGIPNTF